jgi:hypothetical protein
MLKTWAGKQRDSADDGFFDTFVVKPAVSRYRLSRTGAANG